MAIFSRDPERRTYRASNPNRTNTTSLVAAGERIRKRNADQTRRLVQQWQTRAYSYYDLVPEIKYAAQFYSRALSVLRLYAAERDSESGDLVEIEDQNHPAVQMLERIQDPGGGRSGLLSTYGRLMFLGGESYLVVTTDRETEEEQWEMLSPDELRTSGSGYTRFRAPSLAAENYREAPDDAYEPMGADEAVVYRLWKRHPRFSSLADSTMQGVLDVCEELILLTQAVRSRARSRLAGAGILVVNGKVIPAPISGDGADEDALEDPFLKDLIEAMTTPIADEGAASAVVPFVVRVDTDGKLDDVMRHVQISDPTQLYPETGLRREAIERLSIGLDMPPEVLLGIADANHWTGWQIDEQTWKGHLQPVAQQLVDDLNGAFFRPSLRENNVETWRDLYIAYDATAIINHPDRSKDAKDLYDRRAVSKAALREAAGFDEDDAPDETENFEMLGVALRDASVAIYGIPSLKSGGIEPEAGEVVHGDTAGGTVDAGTASPEAKKAPPPEPSGGDQPTPGDVVGSGNGNGHLDVTAAKILGASDLAFSRARELAGSRLRNFLKRDPDLQAELRDVPNVRLAAALGRDRARELRVPADRDLVAGARDLISETLRLWRIDPRIADTLGDRIEQHSARTLYEESPSPLPPSFSKYVSEVST